MQSRVERERLLKLQAIESCGLQRVKDQVPTMGGHHARNRHEAMAAKKIVAEGLLARIGATGRNQLGFGTSSGLTMSTSAISAILAAVIT